MRFCFIVDFSVLITQNFNLFYYPAIFCFNVPRVTAVHSDHLLMPLMFLAKLSNQYPDLSCGCIYFLYLLSLTGWLFCCNHYVICLTSVLYRSKFRSWGQIVLLSSELVLWYYEKKETMQQYVQWPKANSFFADYYEKEIWDILSKHIIAVTVRYVLWQWQDRSDFFWRYNLNC